MNAHPFNNINMQNNDFNTYSYKKISSLIDYIEYIINQAAFCDLITVC